MHQRETIPGNAAIVTAKRMRAIKEGRAEFYHRPKNGIYDPVTFYHILDAVLEMEPARFFRTGEFIETELQNHMMAWDSTTVGRVLTDMAESLHDANATWPIIAARRWNGMTYAVSRDLEDRAALENLLEDLGQLCEALIAEEKEGITPRRLESPLYSCNSVRAPAAV